MKRPTTFCAGPTARRGCIRSLQTSDARIFISGEAFHEPSRLRVADPRSGPRLCEAQRFVVPMRAQKRKEAFHEPAIGARTAMSARIKSEALADKAVRAPVRRWFMVPMRDSEIVEAAHEPGGAKPCRTVEPTCSPLHQALLELGATICCPP